MKAYLFQGTAFVARPDQELLSCLCHVYNGVGQSGQRKKEASFIPSAQLQMLQSSFLFIELSYEQSGTSVSYLVVCCKCSTTNTLGEWRWVGTNLICTFTSFHSVKTLMMANIKIPT